MNMKRYFIMLSAACWLLFICNMSATTFFVDANSTNPVPPYTSWSTAATNIQDAVDASTLYGDLVLVTNGIYQAGGKIAPNDLTTNRVLLAPGMKVQSVNGPAVTVIQGYQVPGTTNGPGSMRCAYLPGGTTLTGFTLTGGATQSYGYQNNISDTGGGIYIAYATLSPQGTVSNCVITGNTANDGGGVGSALYVSGLLVDCIISNNFSVANGGGAWLVTLTNCVVTGNASASTGGGAYGSTLNNCIVSNNSAILFGGGVGQCRVSHSIIISNLVSGGGLGGGAYGGTLNNCTLAGNAGGGAYGGAYAGSFLCTLNDCLLTGNLSGGANLCVVNNSTLAGNAGAGANGGVLNNCIIYDNSPGGQTYQGGSNYVGSTLNYCCTVPGPTAGLGNITSAPLFVNQAGGDYHLQSNSPCINAGKNSYVTNTTDLDGNPRIIGGTVDIGAYEYQTPSSILSYVWAQQYGLPTDGTADYTDSDGDGMSNYAEWKAGTNPTNAASVLALQSPATTNTTGLTVTWQSVSGVTYYLQGSTNLPAFTSIQSNILGQAGTTSYTDTTATNGGPYFYRVGVQ
jgi:hypothetical protein